MSDRDSFRLTPAAETLLLELVTPAGGGPLLVLSGAPMLEELDASEVVSIDLSLGVEELPAQVDTLLAGGPYGGVLIVPPFNVQVPAESFRQPDGWSVQRWFVEEYLIAHAWSRLRPGARIAAMVSPGLLAANRRKDARLAMVTHGLGLVARLPNEAIWESIHQLDTHLALFEHANSPAKPRAMPLAMIDMHDAPEPPPAQAFAAWLQGAQYPDVEARAVFVSQQELGSDVRLEPAYHDPAYLDLGVPEGFDEHLLDDIVELTGGIRVDTASRLTEPPSAKETPFVQVRHLRGDGTLAERPYWLPKNVAKPHLAKRAMPDDILVSVSGTIGKVVLVGPEHQGGVLFDTSIRRLRIKDKDIAAADVAAFLRSELGQLQFRRFTAGAAIPYLANSQFTQIRVFLAAVPAGPEDQAPAAGPGTTQPAPLAQAFPRTIESELRAILQQVSSGDRQHWQQPVAKKLRQLAGELTPTPLADTIRQEFPAPLAIAYRRYLMARHNPYEQLDRMINLIEACTYFVFHVLIADYSRAAWRDKIELPKSSRGVFKTRATFDNRIRFIREITALAREHRLDLFVPSLVDCGIEEDVDEFRRTLRNPVAHSAPGSEAYVARLVKQHQKALDEMLGKLDFLTSYTMCRVRSHYFERGRWHYQCELYRGEEYDTNLQEVPLPDAEQNGRLIAAERDHLVLLSPEYEALDLWPYYQLHFGDATCRESHLCFVKHLTADDRTLHGESVRSGIELALAGFDGYFRPTNAPNPRSAQ